MKETFWSDYKIVAVGITNPELVHSKFIQQFTRQYHWFRLNQQLFLLPFLLKLRVAHTDSERLKCFNSFFNFEIYKLCHLYFYYFFLAKNGNISSVYVWHIYMSYVIYIIWCMLYMVYTAFEIFYFELPDEEIHNIVNFVFKCIYRYFDFFYCAQFIFFSWLFRFCKIYILLKLF